MNKNNNSSATFSNRKRIKSSKQRHNKCPANIYEHLKKKKTKHNTNTANRTETATTAQSTYADAVYNREGTEINRKLQETRNV